VSKVYVIDDDNDIVDVLTIVLEKDGHEIGFQNDEEDVVANVIEFGPDLIILDVIFPENDSAGFEIARNLKHDSQTKEIPILMLSAVNQKGQYAGSFSNEDRDDTYLPVEQFIEKPINPKELSKVVKEMVG
jgi:CheY-like chemotaxis protein